MATRSHTGCASGSHRSCLIGSLGQENLVDQSLGHDQSLGPCPHQAKAGQTGRSRTMLQSMAREVGLDDGQ